jgi:hypothetical protein
LFNEAAPSDSDFKKLFAGRNKLERKRVAVPDVAGVLLLTFFTSAASISSLVSISVSSSRDRFTPEDGGGDMVSELCPAKA